VSRRLRIGLFVAGAAGLGFVLVWGFIGLPSFGDYPGPYGDLISNLAKPQRHIANAVTAVVFDYRGFDTMGEELILFVAATSTAMLLRDTREHQTSDIVDAVRSDATRAGGLLAAIAVLVLGLQVVAHGFLTPGGGFQGGVVLATGLHLLYVTGSYRALGRLRPLDLYDAGDAVGAALFAALGLAGIAVAGEFLANVVHQGTFGELVSAGTVPLLSIAVGVEVSCGMVVLLAHFLDQEMAVHVQGRPGRAGPS